MKKTLLAAVVAGCAAFSGAALADDGQVKFIGDIIDAGCDVVNDLSNPLEVQMGQIAKTAFSGRGLLRLNRISRLNWKTARLPSPKHRYCSPALTSTVIMINCS